MIDFFAKHPTAANLLMVIMIAVGLLSIGGIRRETFPDAAPTEVEVSVLFPGASHQVPTMRARRRVTQRASPTGTSRGSATGPSPWVTSEQRQTMPGSLVTGRP